MDERLKGKGEQVVGKAQEELGKATGDASTERSGQIKRLKGKAREVIGEVKSKVEAEKWRIEPKVDDKARRP